MPGTGPAQQKQQQQQVQQANAVVAPAAGHILCALEPSRRTGVAVFLAVAGGTAPAAGAAAAASRRIQQGQEL